MPRKKASEVQTGGGSPAAITCPACKSQISADGATLHARSKSFDDLLEEAGCVEKLEKLVADWESRFAAKELELKKVKAELEAKSKPEVKKNETVGQARVRDTRNEW